MDLGDFVNQLPSESRLGPLSTYLRQEGLRSPIDMFQGTVSDILRYGTVQRLAETDFLGRLLLLGIVSAAEAYFRAILSGCMEICPVAQATASKQSIPLGGALWHGPIGFSRSASEHTSFASEDDLKSAFKKFLGLTLEDRIFKSSLNAFETVCQLRHGIVHGDGLLPGRNAVLLDIPKYSQPVRITIRYEQLQDVADVITTLVFVLNREIFGAFCKRWAIDWRQRADWEPAAEQFRFSQIWNLFHSKEELARRRGRSKITKGNCIREIKSIFNI